MDIGLRSPGRALGYALILIGVSFAWGAISANVTALRLARPIPRFARNRAIAIPILLAWTALAYLLAHRYLAATGGGATDGLSLGLVFAGVAFAFDLIVIAGIVGAGRRHFEQPVLWLAYVLLIAVPWLVGRAAGVAGH